SPSPRCARWQRRPAAAKTFPGLRSPRPCALRPSAIPISSRRGRTWNRHAHRGPPPSRCQIRLWRIRRARSRPTARPRTRSRATVSTAARTIPSSPPQSSSRSAESARTGGVLPTRGSPAPRPASPMPRGCSTRAAGVARASAAIARETAASFGKTAGLAKEREAAGEISMSEKTQIEIAGGRFLADAAQADLAYANAVRALGALLNMPAVALAEDLDAPGEIMPPNSSVTPEIDETLFARRPDLAALEAAVRKAEADLALQKAFRVP